MIPILETDREGSACTWHGLQYAFTHLPQDFKHSPAIAPATLARELETRKFFQDVTVVHNKT